MCFWDQHYATSGVTPATPVQVVHNLLGLVSFNVDR